MRPVGGAAAAIPVWPPLHLGRLITADRPGDQSSCRTDNPAGDQHPATSTAVHLTTPYRTAAPPEITGQTAGRRPGLHRRAGSLSAVSDAPTPIHPTTKTAAGSCSHESNFSFTRRYRKNSYVLDRDAVLSRRCRPCRVFSLPQQI